MHATAEVVVGGAAGDRMTGNGGSNNRYGEGGSDRIAGAGASDRLYGGAGADTLIGGRGADSLDGGPGADRMRARDGSREAVRCGSARDRANADRVDMLFGCERRLRWRSRARSRTIELRAVRRRAR